MGTGASVSSDGKTHSRDIAKTDSLIHVSEAQETADTSHRSRTKEENGETCDDDNASVDSKDSDDTIIISSRMPRFYGREKTNDIDNHEVCPSKIDRRIESHDHRTMRQTDSSNKHVGSSNTNNNEVAPKDEKIKQTGNIVNNSQISSENLKMNKKDEKKHVKEDRMEVDQFESFKKLYGGNRPKSRYNSSAANKQTLILAKVGTQYKYVAVPSYLPRQKLYRTSPFTKPYIERAETLYKVKQKDLQNSSDTQNENSRFNSGRKSGERTSGVKLTKLPSCSITNTTPTFYIGGINGVSLVEGPLTSLGWKRITDKNDEKFKLKWVESKSTINYRSFKEGEQLVNHIPNSEVLTNKLGLLNSLKEYERVTLSTKGRLPRLLMSEFHPETYKLDEKADRDSFLNVYKDNEMWICKPTGWNQGKGIFLIRSRETIAQTLEEQDQKKQKPQKNAVTRIVQRYITNPLLLEGRKFDIRAYMLVASTSPFLILYHKGYVRLCCHKYEADNTDLGRHLTNQFVQKKDPNYEKLKESTAWSMDKFNEYINESVRPDCPVEIEEDWVHRTFTRQIQKIMIHCFNSVKHKLKSKIGYFDLFGLDFMVDTNMKVYLIEINTNPALACNCKALQEVIPGVVEEALYVSIECFEKSKRKQPLMPLESLKNFTVLYCASHSSTGKPHQSVPPVVENNTAEKPTLSSNQQTDQPTGQQRDQQTSQQRGQQVQQSSIQRTPLYTTNRWKASESKESESNTSYRDRKRNVRVIPFSSVASGKNTKDEKILSPSESSSTNKKNTSNDGKNAKKSEAKNEDAKNDSGSVTLEAIEKYPNKGTKANGNNGAEPTISDNLDKTSVSMKQLPHTKEEQVPLKNVPLKTTHLENSNQTMKSSSAKSMRSREKLERGN